MKTYISNLLKFRELFLELIIKDIKLKYRNSVLGILWSMLNPILMMLVLSIVFMNFFKSSIPNFLVYVLIGRILYQFFSESTTFALSSIDQNAQLIKKVYIPKYYFPLAKVCSTFITSCVALVPLVIVMIITKMEFNWIMLLAIYPLLCLFIICIGIGLIISTITVFFKDMKHFYSVLMLVVLYLTPIFYPISIIPSAYMPIMYLNPLFLIVEMFRDIVMFGVWPDLLTQALVWLYMVVYLSIGLFVFYKKQDKFIYYL